MVPKQGNNIKNIVPTEENNIKHNNIRE